MPFYFDSTLAQDKGEYTTDEINDLIRLNGRLSALEQYLCDLGKKECLKLDARVADPSDPLDDYEIEATLYYTIGTDDPAFDEDEDGFLTQRHISLKCINWEWGLGMVLTTVNRAIFQMIWITSRIVGCFMICTIIAMG